MRKRTRAMMGVFLAATCAFATVATGCGGGGASAAGAEDDVLKIAVPIPLTGESAKAGKELQDTITMAFEEVDNKVAINPPRIIPTQGVIPARSNRSAEV